MCKHAEILGEPLKGLHSVRFPPGPQGFAVVDIILTAGAAYLLSRAFHWSFVLVFLILIVVAVGAHELFCVPTRLNALIFNRAWPPEVSKKN